MVTLAKVIILAAGQGSRLRPYTAHLPKCMLQFGSKTLLQHQLTAFASHGLHDFHVVRGFCGGMIRYDGITYHDNPQHSQSNILNSLFCAARELTGHVIVSYSDILFDPSIVETLLESKHDISIVVDTDWRNYYIDRNDHPISEAEIVVLNEAATVAQIGKLVSHDKPIYGEFIGMMKLTSRGSELLRSYLHDVRQQFWDKPFERAETFQNAYLTDMLQYMVDAGIAVNCVAIARGWKEIDTVEDYEKALREFGDNSSGAKLGDFLRPASFEKVLLIATFLWAGTRHAYAYLDPGTGNMILQFLIAAGVATALFIKRLVYAAKRLFLRCVSGNSAARKIARTPGSQND